MLSLNATSQTLLPNPTAPTVPPKPNSNMSNLSDKSGQNGRGVGRGGGR